MALRRRRAQVLRRWPAEIARPILGHDRARHAAAGRARGLLPFWIAVPVRLDDAFGRAGPGFLADVLWGQYCLFECIRLQDDVFDGHTTDLALVYGANQFLVEAERAFARQFSRPSPFWPAFWRALERSTQAIVRVDALQRRRGRAPARLAREYAGVAAVLGVGTTAVCLRNRRPAAAARLQAIADEWAIGDQILDDLDDVADDLRRGRFNYVAQRVGGRAVGLEPVRRSVARAIALGDGASLVLGDARKRFDRAAVLAGRLGLPGVTAVADAARRMVDDRVRGFARAQARLAFEGRL